MAFPSNPSIGESYTIGLKTWYWDGSAWTLSPVNINGGDGVKVLDDLLDVETGGPPTASERAYTYYINEEPDNVNAWGRYKVDTATKTIRFHRYDIDGNDLEELFLFSQPGALDTEGSKHSFHAADDSFDLMSRVLDKGTNNDQVYYEFVYEDQDVVNTIHNNGKSKLFTIFASDYGALIDGAILVYRQKDELWKPEPQRGGEGGGGSNITIGPNPPSVGNENGDLWIHDLNYYIYVYQNGEWIALTGPEGGTGGGGNFAYDSKVTLNAKRGLYFDNNRSSVSFTLNQPKDSLFSVSATNAVTVSMAVPLDAVEGDLWIYEDDYTMYVYNNGEWVGLTGDDKGSSQIDGRLEQPCVINGGKPFSLYCEDGQYDSSSTQPVYIGTMPPQSPNKGDLWFDSEHLELRVYYVSDVSYPAWVSSTHPGMRPQFAEPDDADPIIITGPTQAVQDTRTGPYIARLSQEVLNDPNRSAVRWDIIDNTIPVDIESDSTDVDASVEAYYKFHGIGVTKITAEIDYTDKDGILQTATRAEYRVSVLTMTPGAPISYNVMVVDDPKNPGNLVYQIDGNILPHLNLERNRRHIFNQNHPSNVGHPLYFYEALNRDPDGSLNDTINIDDKYSEDAIQRYNNVVDLTMPYDAPVRLAYGSDTNTDMGFWVYPYDVDGVVFDKDNPNSYPFP